MQMPETIPLIFIREQTICIVCVYGILIMPAITISRRNFLIQDFFLNNRLWFEMLIKDEDFTERIIQRYHSLRKGLLSEESLYRYIDETLDFIAPALARNDARWGSVEQQAKGLLVPVSRNLDSRSAAEGQLKVTCETEENGWMKTLRLCVNIQPPPV